ncbi:uncharacterized protein METZ01_LOCUS327649 [marine metagenome]|uniref:Uncharacterized protein n=1 Tax=marine metagenome TaxID=408172 RepID=A0A382PQ38_9ZZZZ
MLLQNSEEHRSHAAYKHTLSKAGPETYIR